jgi:hypothetical protein
MSGLAYGTSVRNNFPKMEASYGSCRIRHREPLGPISGSIGYVYSVHSLNPGLATTFEWLSGIAKNYEAYKFHSLSFEYVNRCNANFTGGVVMAPDYDATDAPPGTLQRLEQYQGAYDGSVWKDGLCVLNPRGMGILGPMRYVRTGPLLANQDLKTFDLGKMYIGRQGQENTNVIGELWVAYDVELFVPQAPSVVASGPSAYAFILNESGTGIVSTDYLGSSFTTGADHPITKVGNTFTVNLVPGETYKFIFYLDATSTNGNIGLNLGTSNVSPDNGPGNFGNFRVYLGSGGDGVYEYTGDFLCSVAETVLVFNPSLLDIVAPVGSMLAIFPWTQLP